ncbi:MAG: hypothetical protein IH613_08170 [Desulfuromonadales bacterium]|nr:hypothetical protein [Desulfuromonadales bacterium]
MNIADPKYLEHLRDLPSGYLLDLLADNEDIDKESFYWVLQERGLTREELDQKLQRRRNSNWPRPYRLWTAARWLTLFNTLVVTYFNSTSLYQLLHSDHPFRGPLLFLSVGCILCGFVVGFKLTTHLYQGDRSILYCGFPVPVGFVDLQTGQEILIGKTPMILRMAVNALVGVNLTLFPLIFIYIMMD